MDFLALQVEDRFPGKVMRPDFFDQFIKSSPVAGYELLGIHDDRVHIQAFVLAARGLTAGAWIISHVAEVTTPESIRREYKRAVPTG